MSQQNESDMVLVPRRPTKEMIEAAFWAASDEDAAGVWKAMVNAWLQQSNNGNSESDNG